ncbi:MAG TPA: hypothetical protein VEC19_06565 [Usitatibacter sp.]|nr:hypothetical protein [Usitatibacter sp.]
MIVCGDQVPVDRGTEAQVKHVFSLDAEAAASLFSRPGLEGHRPSRVIAFFEDGSHAAVVAYNPLPGA